MLYLESEVWCGVVVGWVWKTRGDEPAAVVCAPPLPFLSLTHFGFASIKSTPDITDRTHGVAGNWSVASSPAGGGVSAGPLPTRRVPCRAAARADRALAHVRVRVRWASNAGENAERECTRVCGAGAHNEFAFVYALIFFFVLWRASTPTLKTSVLFLPLFERAMRATRALAALRPRLAMQACSAAPNASPTVASSFLAVNVYVSEGRTPTTLATLTAAASSRQSVRGDGHTTTGASLVHTFVDEPYNRTGFTLAGPAPDPPSSGLTAATLALCDAALAAIDWGAVAAACGCCHPPCPGRGGPHRGALTLPDRARRSRVGSRVSHHPGHPSGRPWHPCLPVRVGLPCWPHPGRDAAGAGLFWWREEKRSGRPCRPSPS